MRIIELDDADGYKMSIERDNGERETFTLGYRDWLYTPIKGYPPYSITAINRMQNLNHDFVAAAAHAWTKPTKLEVRIHYVNWISGTTYVFDFEKNSVTVRDNYPNSKPETIPFSAT